MRRPKGGYTARRILKGQTWQVEEMLKLFLLIVVFGGSVLLIIGATGGLNNVLNNFCERNPSWCGQSKATPTDYLLAQNSVNALVCAVNTIAKGERLGIGCSDFYGEPPEREGDAAVSIPSVPAEYIAGTGEDQTIPGGGVGNIVSKDYSDFMTGLATGSSEKNDKSVVHCKSNEVCCEYDSEFGIHYEWLSKDICDVIGGRENSDSSKCGPTNLECTIYNFQLPQRFEGTAKASEWIGGFGDPLFLVYWQAFPSGEESDWGGKSSWYKGLGTVAFGAMCIVGVARGAIGLVKAGGRIVSSSTQRAASYVSGKFKGFKDSVLKGEEALTTERWKTMFRFVEESKGTRNSVFSKLKPYLYAGLKSDGTAAESFSLFRTAKAALPGTVGYTTTIAGVNTIDAYIWSRIDSEFGKFFPDEKEPDKLMLHMPLNEREPFDLLTKEREIPVPDTITDPHKQNLVSLSKPVLLAKEGYDLGIARIGDELKPFWLASPCRTDLKVTESEVACQLYSYDSTTGLTMCVTPKKTGFLDSAKVYRVGCGSIPNIGKDLSKVSEVSKKEAEFIQDMDSFQVFKDNVEIKTVSRERGKYLECSCGDNFPDTFVLGKGLNVDEVISDCEAKSGLDKSNIFVGACHESGTAEPSQNKIKAKQCKCTITFKGTRWPFSNPLGIDYESYFVYGIDESDARRKCEADAEHLKETVISLSADAEVDKAEISECNDYEGDFLPSADIQEVAGRRFYEIYDPINEISFYYDRTSEKVEYSRNAEGVITEQISSCLPENPDQFFNVTGFGIGKIYKCKLEFGKDPDGRDIIYNFIGTVADDGENLGEFIGLRINYINTAMMEDITTKSITLKDFSTITVGEEKQLNLDGKIDEVGDYLYIPMLGSDEIIYQRAFVDSSPYDGTPDSVTSLDCKVRAITVQPDMEPYEDDEGPNYCYKTNYEDFVDVVSTTGYIGVSVFAKAAKFGGIVGWGLSTLLDCGLAIYSATSGTSWPEH
jgi:hypothetical protein